MRTAKTLIRLGRCPGWSESSLGTHAILFVLSWGGSYSSPWNTPVQPSSGTTDVALGLEPPLVPFIVCANNEDSGETARMRRLAYMISTLFTWASSFLYLQRQNVRLSLTVFKRLKWPGLCGDSSSLLFSEWFSIILKTMSRSSLLKM